jgi:hypothetical protein
MKHNFTLNQNVLWITNDNGNKQVVKATITEVNEDHCIAYTSGNNNNTDNMILWIDEDNEMEFFDVAIMEKIFNI